MRLLVRPALLLLAVICAAAAMGKTDAATRLALVGGEGNGGVENVLDIATALLGRDADLQLLDRAEVGRVLREHELALGGLVGAEHAVKTGQLLQADLFAVLEGSLTNGIEGTTSLGLVVFDAKAGARYADSALLASNTASAAAATAEAVRAAVAKYHRKPEDLRTLGLLTVRNADLPRQLDGLCDTVGLLLERELTASTGIAVLERRRLEQVTRERSVAPDAEGNRLLSSLRMIELDIGQDGAGLRGTLALIGADGARSNTITASVPRRDAAGLAHVLAVQTERFLNAPSVGLPANRAAEAARFHREYLLLYEHRDWIAAVRALDAALALAPEQASWRREMALLLPFAAIELVDPGGQNWARRLPAQPSSGDLAHCLALGQRGADLLLDLSREAVAAAKPGEVVPDVIRGSYHDRLCQLLGKLADVKTADPGAAAEIGALADKERTVRMEVAEPFLSKWSVNKTTFATYSGTLASWFSGGWWGLPRFGSNPEERAQDDVLALSHWVEVSHRLNPPDGSGDYRPIAWLGIFRRYQSNQVEEFRQTLERDQDPVIRVYAHAGRVASLMGPYSRPSDQTLAAEREFRLYAQDLLARGEAVKPGPLRDHVWEAIKDTLALLLNHDKNWEEYLEACRFAFALEEIHPDLFSRAAEALENPGHRKIPEELEVVNGALALTLAKPEAFPKPKSAMDERKAFIRDFQNKRERLAHELAGASATVPAPSSWKQEVCLLDLATPINGFAWLFKPVVQDGQVFALALGVHEWGLPEDSLQLVRVPLQGGTRQFLGRAEITGLDWVNRPYLLARGQRARLTDTAAWVDVGRAACVGAGCYYAATCSGIYIFPTNGGPVLHLGATNGLPSEDTYGVVFLDGKLYISAGEADHGGYLVTYEPATRKVAILASSRRSERLSPFDDQQPFHAAGLVADPIRHRLVMAISSSFSGPAHKSPGLNQSTGIWSYLPLTGEFKQLAPLRLPASGVTMKSEEWAGLANSNTLAVKGLWTLALFDLLADRFLSVYDASTAFTNATMARWQIPDPGYPGQYTVANGPYILRDAWFYSARPFERMALADGRREQFPPLRTDYPFEPKESLQLLDDGKHILAADQYSIWLLELTPEAAQAPLEDYKSNPAAGKP